MSLFKFFGLYLIIISILVANQAGAVFFDSSHPALSAKPAYFVVVDRDNFYGQTTTGEAFTQTRIVSDVSLRIHKFTLGSLYFYISDKGTFSATNDLKAISIYLSLT